MHRSSISASISFIVVSSSRTRVAAAELMKVTPREAKGRSLIDLLRNPELLTFARETLATGTTREAEVLLSGDPARYLQVHAGFIKRTAAPGGGGLSETFERLVLVLNDITTLKTLERIRQDWTGPPWMRVPPYPQFGSRSDENPSVGRGIK